MYVNKQQQRTQLTRARMEKVARKLFASEGFAAVSAEVIVEKAEVTRGALYHHYGGKEGLFEAVVETMMRELHESILKDSKAGGSPVNMLKAGVKSFLVHTGKPAIQRVLLTDAPNVLGWARWRELDKHYGLGMLINVFEAAQAAGMLAYSTPATAAHVLIGAMIESAMLVSTSSNRKKTQKEAEEALFGFIESTLIAGPGTGRGNKA